jgi:hypothetical protein
MVDVHGAGAPPSEGADEEAVGAATWIVRLLYGGLIVANLYLVFDWWRDTDQGRSLMERFEAKLTAARAKAAECEGCARRKAKLAAAMNRMHWQAERIVEGEDIETQPEAP